MSNYGRCSDNVSDLLFNEHDSFGEYQDPQPPLVGKLDWKQESDLVDKIITTVCAHYGCQHQELSPQRAADLFMSTLSVEPGTEEASRVAWMAIMESLAAAGYVFVRQ